MGWDGSNARSYNPKSCGGWIQDCSDNDFNMMLIYAII